MFKLESMKPINVNDYHKDVKGNINPFHTDSYSMGRKISKDIFMMYTSHDTEEFDSAYYINTKTGERQRMVKI